MSIRAYMMFCNDLEKIEGMAAFRNILVHDYMRLDRKKVYEIITNKTCYPIFSLLPSLNPVFQA